MLLLCTAAPLEASITLQFDYTHDSTGFFDNATTNGAHAKATLEAAADFYNSIVLDDLDPILPSDNINGYTFQPDASNTPLYVYDMNIPKDTLVIYVGAYNYDGGILGRGGPGLYFQPPFDSAMARGEGSRQNVLGPSAKEFAPWGGAVSFDSDTNWNYDYTSEPEWNEVDLYSVVLHEISHVLGIGIAESWDNLISSNLFYGTESVAEYGGPVTIDEGGGHWADNTASTVFGGYASQEAAMTPYTYYGTRKVLTALDATGLDDIGWDIYYPLGAYGDANLDETVDELDVAIMATNWLRSDATWSQGDFNGDGTVDDEDAALLSSNWLTSSTGNTASVPEPDSAILLLSALAMISVLKRK